MLCAFGPVRGWRVVDVSVAREKVPDSAPRPGPRQGRQCHAPACVLAFSDRVSCFGMGFSRTGRILIAAGGSRKRGRCGGTSRCCAACTPCTTLSAPMAAFRRATGGIGSPSATSSSGCAGGRDHLSLAYSNGSPASSSRESPSRGVHAGDGERWKGDGRRDTAPRTQSLVFGILACANSVGDRRRGVYFDTLMAPQSTLAVSIAADSGRWDEFGWWPHCIRAVARQPAGPPSDSGG